MKIKIEVGANKGTETRELASDGSIVYAFEPTYELLIEHLWPLSHENNNIRILPFAVDSENSFKQFNVAGHWDWGCSSLYEFSDNLDKDWPGRVDFSKTHSYIVPTITLYNFCELYKIETIDFLHIDAQGNDFNVLKSLKDKISIVKEGVIEASNNVELYKNTNNKINDIREYLISNGFEIVKETINDAVSAEVNIYYKKI
jgi:FkbM family methyltransferase